MSGAVRLVIGCQRQDTGIAAGCYKPNRRTGWGIHEEPAGSGVEAAAARGRRGGRRGYRPDPGAVRWRVRHSHHLADPEIAIPATTSDAGLPKALLELWPRYLAYVLSFVVIARFWVTHHLAFRLIGRYDAGLVWLNLLLLMLVAFLPFPTAVLGENNGSPAAAVLYAAAVILAGTASAAY